MEVEITEFVPSALPSGSEIIVEVYPEKVVLSSFSIRGRESKRIIVNRFLTLDDLFFEGLGLWQGEGSKDKGLYFCNSCIEILLYFLRFVEERIGLPRKAFRVVLHVPRLDGLGSELKEKWSKKLAIPVKNFTSICVDPRMNRVHVQIYFNSIVLVELLKALHEGLKPLILSRTEFAAAYLRGIFAAEGSVILRKSGVLHHVNISSGDKKTIEFLEKCFSFLGITVSKYETKGRNLPVHGRRNFEQANNFDVYRMNPEKRAKFELGFANYKRVNVLDGEEARSLTLQQLATGSKTYGELAVALGKARTTIQTHHIPILEREGKVKRVGKRGQAWLFALAENPSSQQPKFK